MGATCNLIVNADDFGRTFGVNQGVIKTHELGIVTAASLMVRWPAATEAASYSRTHEDLSIGLHFDFGEWVCRNGTWSAVYEVVGPNESVREEAFRQLEAFRTLIGTDPTHVDSHQHFHTREPFRSVLIAIARELDVPLRGYSPEIRYCGAFYGQTGDGAPNPEGITTEGLIKILADLQPGITELSCHPGEVGDLESTYNNERGQEVGVLCDPLVRTALDSMGVELRAF